MRTERIWTAPTAGQNPFTALDVIAPITMADFPRLLAIWVGACGVSSAAARIGTVSARAPLGLWRQRFIAVFASHLAISKHDFVDAVCNDAQIVVKFLVRDANDGEAARAQKLITHLVDAALSPLQMIRSVKFNHDAAIVEYEVHTEASNIKVCEVIIVERHLYPVVNGVNIQDCSEQLFVVRLRAILSQAHKNTCPFWTGSKNKRDILLTPELLPQFGPRRGLLPAAPRLLVAQNYNTFA